MIALSEKPRELTGKPFIAHGTTSESAMINATVKKDMRLGNQQPSDLETGRRFNEQRIQPKAYATAMKRHERGASTWMMMCSELHGNMQK